MNAEKLEKARIREEDKRRKFAEKSNKTKTEQCSIKDLYKQVLFYYHIVSCD